MFSCDAIYYSIKSFATYISDLCDNNTFLLMKFFPTNINESKVHVRQICLSFSEQSKKTQLNTKTGRSKLKRYDFILWPSNNCGHFVFVLNLKDGFLLESHLHNFFFVSYGALINQY